MQITTALTTALKEWSVAVDAIARGETIMLLRKGGIKESQGHFSAQSDRAILFPTFEHQKPELLKPAYRPLVEPVTPGWHPEHITLKAWADITHIFRTDDADQVAALSAFHIWEPQLALERLKWKPKQPLYVLILRAYRLSAPVDVAWQPSYGGCRSWIELAAGATGSGLSREGSEAAISDADYDAQVEAIAHLLSRPAVNT
ncbi:MAG: DUF1802 family protein [Phormidesmis sp.]